MACTKMLLFFLLLLSAHRAACQQSFVEAAEDLIKNGCDCKLQSGLDVSEIKVYTYNYETTANNSYYVGDGAAAKILKALSVKQCIDIFVPGFASPIEDVSVNNALCVLSRVKCNRKNTFAIVFDHSAYTDKNISNSTEKYLYAVKYAKSIGEKIGQVIVKLLNFVNEKDVNILGHSLGGQIVGHAADFVKKVRRPLPIIYTADPAGICFQNCTQAHVRSGQAGKVVTVHCTTFEGTNLYVADYDIVANDGEKQPGCDESNSSCSHRQCVSVAMLPAIRGGWEATRCSSYDKYISGECDCRDRMLVGYRIPPTCSDGRFYFKTPSVLNECNLKP